jgi:hypothetical protein
VLYFLAKYCKSESLPGKLTSTGFTLTSIAPRTNSVVPSEVAVNTRLMVAQSVASPEKRIS